MRAFSALLRLTPVLGWLALAFLCGRDYLQVAGFAGGLEGVARVLPNVAWQLAGIGGFALLAVFFTLVPAGAREGNVAALVSAALWAGVCAAALAFHKAGVEGFLLVWHVPQLHTPQNIWATLHLQAVSAGALVLTGVYAWSQPDAHQGQAGCCRG